jgi:D-alanyl-lipoteichoic acid acyltransferase DltB (MBOAT superfamily)
MDTASFQFVFFGLAAALLSNLSRSRVWRSFVLLAASFLLLALLAHNPIVFLPLAGFLLLGYVGLLLIERGWSRSVPWSIVAVVLVYIWLKKYTFLPAATFLQHPYFTLGLSYIVFRVLHLLIETGDGDEKRHVGLGAYLVYTLNFTTLVSGPIQRYDEFARDQFALEPIALGPRVIGLQLERIVRGFFKINVLAMLLHAVQEDALAQMAQPLPLTLKLFSAFRLAVVYPFFLYANFSGYIDIVIALARLMRVRLPENFDRPFSASSFLDFWNRWHITLSTWLKTYVYNPLLLALMRRVSSVALQPSLGVLCFFVTFFLVGIWHGRTSEFIVFGVLQGGGISINKIWQLGLARALGRKGYKDLAKNPLYIDFGRGLTFSWFAFTLFWFWANWKQIHTVFSAISVLQWCGVWLAIWLCATLVFAAWERLRAALLSITIAGTPVLTSRYALVIYASALGLAALVMTVLLNQPAPDIVYKAF